MATVAGPWHILLNLSPSLHSRRKSTATRLPNSIHLPTTSFQNPKTLKPTSSSQNPEPLKCTSLKPLPSLQNTLAISTTTGLFSLFGTSLTYLYGGSGDGGGGRGGNGGGGGGGDGGFWSKVFSPAAIAKEDESQSQEWDSHGLPANIVVQLNKLSGFKRYKVSEILFLDQHRNSTIGTGDFFFEIVSLRPGGIYTKAQFQKELETLATCGSFEKVDLKGMTNPDGTIGITIPFTETTWKSADKFRCINVGLIAPIEMDPDTTAKDYESRMGRARPCLLPMPVHGEVLQMLAEQGNVSPRLVQKIEDRVKKWYHEEGYVFAQVVNFVKLSSNDELVCEVVEGDITQLVIQFQDKVGNVCQGNTQLAVLRRELPKQLRQGHVFNIEAGKQAEKNLNTLALFSNIEVNPIRDEKNKGGIIVEINLKELEQRSDKVCLELPIIGGRGRHPILAPIHPGGTYSFEIRNLKGLNRSFLGSGTISNFLNPQADHALNVEYVHPYLDGVYNLANRTFRASCFLSRTLSPVFTGGPELDEVPPIWVDRAGVKANIAENFTHQSKFTYGLVMEEIATRDEIYHISPNAPRMLPTTLSGTGVDRMVFAQANITLDNTKFVNAAIVGERNVFQVDQGLGIGSNFPFFNRHQLTVTRFIQLKEVEEGAGKPQPPVLVLHCHYGGYAGDLPSYDAFTLGGPYSVRGYNMGEIGAARNILELAAELRIPVKNTHVYAFAEHGNDLGSSKDVKGNPTLAYGRRGQGSSFGVGVKLGPSRTECIVDLNCGTGALFFRYGERF